MSTLTNEHAIKMFIHCGQCGVELMDLVQRGIPTSPRDYQAIEAGWTKEGLQIWCKRHECNIVHIDFEGVKHPANTTRKA